jgi:hypothetical protein
VFQLLYIKPHLNRTSLHLSSHTPPDWRGCSPCPTQPKDRVLFLLECHSSCAMKSVIFVALVACFLGAVAASDPRGSHPIFCSSRHQCVLIANPNTSPGSVPSIFQHYTWPRRRASRQRFAKTVPQFRLLHGDVFDTSIVKIFIP